MEQEAQVDTVDTVDTGVVDTPDNPDYSDDSRPEWLPEKFSDPADLGKAYKALESKLGEKEDAMRERIMSELSESVGENVPKSSGEYELPEFVNPEEAVDNPLLQQWADHCYENGYTHAEFQKGIEMYMNGVGTGPDLEAEAAKLGENGEARIQAVSLFANKFFPESAMPAIERMCETHEGIIALEIIMEQMKDPSVSEQTNIAANFDESELQEMMRDERYWNPARRDPNWVKKVQDGFKAIYG